MTHQLRFLIFIFANLITLGIHGQGVSVAGRVIDGRNGKPVEFASVLLQDNDLLAISDEKGDFTIKNVSLGKHTLVVQSLGYVKKAIPITLAANVYDLKITLSEENLQLDEVEVVAQRREDEATTSYVMDRATLDHQQMLNIVDIASLLPGGKTVNSTLMDDSRLALRSDGQEKGNASFGTAVEVDGARVDNNATMGETMSASTRNISSSNVESIEVVAGIPSVEYGDLSNGVVKINTRKGKSPFIVEASINPHTRQVAVNKGVNLGKRGGMLNASFEHARSFSDYASPYTAYQRNVLSLHYMNTFFRGGLPLTLNAGITGNIGGYNSKSDPDNTLESYAKVRDNLLRGNLELNWLLNKPWITNVSLKGSFSFQDKLSENYSNAASASTQPYIHTREEGYFVAADYDADPYANIILGPTGYWYVRSYGDQKPVSYTLKLKANWARRFGKVMSRLMLGIDFKSSGNNGRGTYYEDMRLAPTWREYRYDELPWMNDLAFFAEEKLTVPTSRLASLQVTAGLRDDITMISGSDYGNVSSLSPRVNMKYVFWSHRKTLVSDLSIHAGWGKSVKLPSFQVLYPSPSYTDVLAFTPGSTADNKAYYAYYTYPSTAIYNPDLKWQYTNQTDIGVEARVKGTRISLSGFYHKTYHPYMLVNQYTPFGYRLTGQEAIENSGVAPANRSYAIDRLTGQVTLFDLSGANGPMLLDNTEHHTYNTTRMYTNGNTVERYGLEWMVDFAQIKPLRTSLRLDGNYYYYKGIDETLFASSVGSIGDMTNPSYPLLGYYRGSSSTSTGTAASASVSNGSESQQLNLNATLTTHIPRVRMIVTLRLESSLYNYKRALSELGSGTRGIALERVGDYFGETYNKSMRDKYVAVYPEYYSTWDNPSELIPFAEKLVWAKDNDQALYNQLARLIVKSNYAYVLNPNRLSRYFSANFSVTKELGDHVSISFYANNFFNNMGHVKSSQTGLKSSLFASGYIPRFYYGMSVRLKI